MSSPARPKPRQQNRFTDDTGRSIVAKVPHLNGDFLPASVRTAIALVGGLDRAIHAGESVLLKPNFNTACATPLSTDLAFLAAAIEILQDAGARVTVGEMSGRMDWPTESVINRLGVPALLSRYGVPFVDFQHDEWLEVEVPGHYWRALRVPRTAYEAEKRVYLANMRCHSSARFSCSLKLGVGWISPDDREELHRDRTRTEAMVAEVHLGWQPDLVLVDGRRSTVGWHGRGDYVYPNVLMASGDMVAIDTEAVRILQTYPAENRLDIPVDEMPQLVAACRHGLGSMDYVIRDAPAHHRTEQDAITDPAAVEIGREMALASQAARPATQ